jgi:hypothetical protein
LQNVLAPDMAAGIAKEIEAARLGQDTGVFDILFSLPRKLMAST